MSLAVGVFGGVEAAFGVGHVAEDVTEDAVGGIGECDLAAGEERLEIELCELGVVVEHLLEVGHQPGRIHGVTGETATELVVNASGVHVFAGFDDHAQRFGVAEARVIREKEQRLTRAGEFGRATEPAVAGIEFGLKGSGCFMKPLKLRARFGRGIALGRLLQLRMNVPGGLFELGPSVAPEPADLLEDLAEGGSSVAWVGGEIGAAIEGFEFRGEEDIEGPAALAGGGLHKGHVDLVHVGSFFAIDFDADEMLVEDFGGLLVFERFPFHDVTPMAGGIADAEEDGFRLAPGEVEGFFAPGIPVYRIVLVLAEVG